MTKKSDVVAIVLNWRDEHRTSECANALLIQEGVDHVVVVDNESTAESYQRLTSALDAAIEVVRVAENRGFGGGMNVALRRYLDSCSAILLVNNDLVLDTAAISALIGTMRTDQHCGAVAPVIYDFPVGQLLQVQSAGGFLSPWTGTVKQQRTLNRGVDLDYLSFACVLLRSAALAECGLFNESFFMYWEDVEMCRRITRAGWTLSINPDARSWHELSASRGTAGDVLLSYGTWSASTFARMEGGPWPCSVPVRAILSSALRALVGRRSEAGALLRGLRMDSKDGTPAYIQLANRRDRDRGGHSPTLSSG